MDRGYCPLIAYAWSSYDPVIIVVGHESKMMALDYAPGYDRQQLLMIFQRNYLSGAALLILFLVRYWSGTQHLQVVYYTLFILGLLTLAFLVHLWRQKALKTALAPIGLLLPPWQAPGIGFATYAVTLLPLQEYAKETMRGEGRTSNWEQYKKNKETNRGRSDQEEYAVFSYSYGIIGETSTLLVPHIFGGWERRAK